jgi:hypothetical protein
MVVTPLVGLQKQKFEPVIYKSESYLSPSVPEVNYWQPPFVQAHPHIVKRWSSIRVITCILLRLYPLDYVI